MDGPVLYHERQTMLKCGVHAVNNLLGRRAFVIADFERLAKELSPGSFWTFVGAGNYDVNVLGAALSQEGLVTRKTKKKKKKKN
jgi:hypothetical protein